MVVSRTPIAATQPFALSALRLHARVDQSDDDESLDLMARTAAAEIEQYSGLALLRQRIAFTVEATAGPIRLPIGPLLVDGDILIDGSAFTGTVTVGQYATIVLPDTLAGQLTVTYEAGFGDSLDDVPPDLQLAIIDHAARLFDARGALDAKQGLSVAATRIAARYKQVRI